MNSGIVFLVAAALASCTLAPNDGPRGRNGSAASGGPAVAVYDAIWPAVDTMMSQTWDGKYGHPLRLDRRGLRMRGAGAADSSEIVTAAEAERWIARGYMIGQCPPLTAEGRCEPAGATLVVQFSPVTFHGDAARVELQFYGDTFGATWEVSLTRAGAGWKVQSHRMTSIS